MISSARSALDDRVNPMRDSKSHVLCPRDKLCRRIIDFGILALIVISPLPAASVHEWSILVIELSVLVMTAAFLVMKEKPEGGEGLSDSLKWAHYAFLGLFIFLAFQMVPWPGSLVRLLSPGAFSFRQSFSPPYAPPSWTTFSLLPFRTLERSLELLSYVLLGFIVLRTVRHRSQILRIFFVLTAMGVFEAFYGLFELSNSNPRILFYKKISNLDSVTGTFVNRNHFSGYLEMILPLAIGLVLARVGAFSLSGLNWREKILRISEKRTAATVLLSLGIILMGVALVFSKSRAGVFILVFSFFLFFILSTIFFESDAVQKKGARNFLRVIFICLLIVVFYIGIQSTIQRFSLDRLLQEGRPAFWSNTLKIISDFPAVGTGLGTFSSIYPDLYGEMGPLQLSHAHNDYLEYLSELGMIGLLLLVAGIFVPLARAIKVLRERRHPEVKALGLGALISILGILVHGITDFNLHIPANLLLFSLVLSLTTSLAFYRRAQSRQP